MSPLELAQSLLDMDGCDGVQIDDRMLTLAREVLRLSLEITDANDNLEWVLEDVRRLTAERDEAIARAEKAERLAAVWVEELEWLETETSHEHGGGVLSALKYNVEHRDEIRAAEAPDKDNP